MILFWLPGLGGPRGPRDAPRSIPGVGMTSGTSVASGGSPGPVAGGLALEERRRFFAQATQCGPRVQARVGGQTLDFLFFEIFKIFKTSKIDCGSISHRSAVIPGTWDAS